MNSNFYSRDDSADKNLINNIADKYNIDKIVANILVMRGIDSLDKAEKFINCGIKNLHDPFLLDGMREAAVKIEHHIKSKSSIVIYGDYDADGICSVAILYLYLLSKDVEVNWYIPEREEGYGINFDAVDFIHNLYKPDLIISVDCGITAVEEVKYIINKGMDIIITDHHNSLEIVPDCIIVNPKTSQVYPFKELCGAGVALKVVQALGGIDQAAKYIDIAAIATVADSVELYGENRDIVYEGIKKLNTDCRKGIKYLYDVASLSGDFNTYTIAFGIVPRINAAGRIGEAKRALALFYENQDDRLKALANELNCANLERQQLCESIISQSYQQVRDNDGDSLHIISIIDGSSQTGISGIVASKLCEQFYRPAFVFCECDGVLKGSGRSVEGINIFEMLSSMSELFVRYGGHAYAAGVTVSKENYNEFVRRADLYLNNQRFKPLFVKKQYYDFDLTGTIIDSKFIKQLEVFEPCGVGNAKPKFLYRAAALNAAALSKHPKHLSFKITDTEFIAFNFGDYIDILNSDMENSLLFELKVNKYNGKEYAKGYLKDFNYDNSKAEHLREKMVSNYLCQLECKKSSHFDINYFDFNDIEKLIDEKLKTFGTLIVVSSNETLERLYKAAPKLKNLSVRLFNADGGSNNSKIILAPNIESEFKGYRHIIFADKPLHKGYLAKIKTLQNNVYVPSNCVNNILSSAEISLSRSEFAKYYKLLNDRHIKSKSYTNLGNLFYKLKKISKEITLTQLTVCLIVFRELGIIDTNGDILKINNAKKSSLTNSAIYNTIGEIIDFKE